MRGTVAKRIRREAYGRDLSPRAQLFGRPAIIKIVSRAQVCTRNASRREDWRVGP